MRIAVTGRFGQIAQSLVERGPNSNMEVLTLARPAVDLARPSDLTDVLGALRPQAVVSAAAYTAVDLAESEPVLAYQINANGAEALARAAARLRIPIVHLSTDYVFDGALDRPYCEEDAPRHRDDRRSEEHTSELQSQSNLVCRLLLEKKKSAHSSPYNCRMTGTLGPRNERHFS